MAFDTVKKSTVNVLVCFLIWRMHSESYFKTNNICFNIIDK